MKPATKAFIAILAAIVITAYAIEIVGRIKEPEPVDWHTKWVDENLDRLGKL